MNKIIKISFKPIYWKTFCNIMMNNTKSVMGKVLCLFVMASLFSGVTPNMVYAETVSVSITGNSYDISYTGTNVSITGTDIDTDFDSLIFDVDVSDAGVLEITIPRNALDAQFEDIDEPFIIIAGGAEPMFSETDTTLTSRTLRIDLDVGTAEIEIIGTVLGKQSTGDGSNNNSNDDDGNVPPPSIPPPPPPSSSIPPPPPPSIPPPPPPPSSVVDPLTCADDDPPVCGVDGNTYSNMCDLTTSDIELDHDGECIIDVKSQSNNNNAGNCGANTVLRNGACVPACGAGLVLQNNICVLDTTTLNTPPAIIDDKSTTITPPTVNEKISYSGLIYGVIGGFGLAFIVILVLGLMSRLSRSNN